jgi:hypothetical protein
MRENFKKKKWQRERKSGREGEEEWERGRGIVRMRENF